MTGPSRSRRFPRPRPRPCVALALALAAPAWLGGPSAPARADEAVPSAPPLVEDAPNALSDAKGYLVLGVGNRPEYAGARARRSSPFFVSRFRLPRFEVSLEGLDWYLDVLPSRVWRAGVSASFDLPRDDTVAEDPVAALPALGHSVSPGLYAGFEMPNDLLPEGLASARIGVRSAFGGQRRGNSLSVDVDYFFAPLFFWRVGVAANAVFVDRDRADAEFGIDAAAAEASGLAPYRPDGGLHSVGASVYTILSISQRLGVFGRWAVSTLQDDASSSPIVAEAGRTNQRFSGVGLFYLFR